MENPEILKRIQITLTDGHEATDARVVDPGPAAAAAPPPSSGHKAGAPSKIKGFIGQRRLECYFHINITIFPCL